LGYGMGRRYRRSLPFTTNMPSIPKPSPKILRIVMTTEDDKGLSSLIAARFARAPFITLVDASEGRILNVNVIRNSIASLPHGAGVALGQWLASIGVDVVMAVTLGPNISMILNQAGIRVERIPYGTKVKEALARLGISA